ncbi:MAG: hypothetical protein ACLQBX_02470 [Candidatus Limnocylindrales bacterium]
MPLLPWRLYLEQGLGAGNLAQTAWNGSAWRFPILIPPTLLGLCVLRKRGAEWFAVPAIWPWTEFYYVAMALPAVAGYPILAAALALPMPPMTPIVVMVYVAWVHWPALATRVRQVAPAQVGAGVGSGLTGDRPLTSTMDDSREPGVGAVEESGRGRMAVPRRARRAETGAVLRFVFGARGAAPTSCGRRWPGLTPSSPEEVRPAPLAAS